MSDDGKVSLQALYRSVRALKGHLTRRIVSAKKAIQDVGAHLTSDSISDLQNYMAEVQQQYEKIEASYTEILECIDNEDEIKEFGKEPDEESKKADSALSKIRAALRKASGAPRVAPDRAPA